MDLSRKVSARSRIQATAVALLLSVAAIGVNATTATAAAPQIRIDMKVLIVTDQSGSADAIKGELDIEGIPYTVVDVSQPGRPIITDAFLSDTLSTGPRAKYQSVVLSGSGVLGAEEYGAISKFESAFGIREVQAYVFPTEGWGLTRPTINGYMGQLDGFQVNVTDVARSANVGPFRYLNSSFKLDDVSPSVTETYGYVSQPIATPLPAGVSLTPLVTTAIPGTNAQGVLVGELKNNGRETLFLTFSMNNYQSQARILGKGIVTWMTKGIHLGYSRSYFGVHIDDIFLPDSRWSASRNCTPGSDCALLPTDAPSIRMTSADVTYLANWQRAQGIKLDMTFNGSGSDDYVEQHGGKADPLATAFIKKKTSFRWINHTFSHDYLGCVQDWSVVPWTCVKTATGATKWASTTLVQRQVQENLAWAAQRGISVPSNVLVTGEHSGLKSLPQMTKDNPNVSSVLGAVGVTVTASDASREKEQRVLANGVTVTLPRYPMNIYYNVGTYLDEVDEYNWIYTSRANGGSGLCEDNPATSTCVAPISADQAGFMSRIVPGEVRVAMSHVLANDPRPHYAHQSNLSEDRLLYPVVDSILATYRSTFAANSPILNPSMQQASDALIQQRQWAAALKAKQVSAYILGGKVKIQSSDVALRVPLTLPNGSTTSSGGVFGSAYADERSTWTSSKTLILP